jgi:multidrug efflux pump subunit AcrB
MWIVRVALNRPYTFIVLALLIFILGPVTILNTPTDIFPNINIPVIAVAWIYIGLNAEDIEARITTPYEKTLTGRQHSAHRIDELQRRSNCENLPAARGESGYR